MIYTFSGLGRLFVVGVNNKVFHKPSVFGCHCGCVVVWLCGCGCWLCDCWLLSGVKELGRECVNKERYL